MKKKLFFRFSQIRERFSKKKLRKCKSNSFSNERKQKFSFPMVK